MYEKYNLIREEYEEYLKKYSKYKPNVNIHNTYKATSFPFITFELSNFTNSSECTIDKIEYYDNFYFTINIYTKDKIVNNQKIASQIVNDELIELTVKFFKKKNMLRTTCRPTFNVDTDILRTTIQYQCMIGNARGNIIRR